MIFGFNSDIKLRETTYHVQSEVRTSEQLFQTQVFVQGRCVGKRDLSYAERVGAPSFTEEAMQEALREQHRWVVDAIRDGYIDQFTREYGEVSTPAENPKTSNSSGLLQLRFLNSSRPQPDQIVICFQTLYGAKPAGGVLLKARLLPQDGARSTFSGDSMLSATSQENGSAEIAVPVDPQAHGEAILLVQASHGRDQISKKFRLHASV